jgi:hypothetical protein
LPKAHDLITSSRLHRGEGGRGVHGPDDGTEPALADRIHLPKVIGWGWFYLTTILDDFPV